MVFVNYITTVVACSFVEQLDNRMLMLFYRYLTFVDVRRFKRMPFWQLPFWHITCHNDSQDNSSINAIC